jgi:hypothetical protein
MTKKAYASARKDNNPMTEKIEKRFQIESTAHFVGFNTENTSYMRSIRYRSTAHFHIGLEKREQGSADENWKERKQRNESGEI